MKKIFLIVEREFLTRVKKRSFILTTLLVPLLLGALMVIPALMMTVKDDEKKTIVVIDRSGLAEQALANTAELTFDFRPTASLDSLKLHFTTENLYAVLTVGELDNDKNVPIELYSFKQTNMNVQSYIKEQVEKAVEQYKLASYEIQGLEAIMAAVKTKLKMKTYTWDAEGNEKASSTGITMGLSYVFSFLIYMFIFLFGSMVLRGVIEEKSSRIVEVIISSVKPFQLMMGKIIGIASVGLLQFLIWVVLVGVLWVVGLTFLLDGVSQSVPTGGMVGNEAMQQVAASSMIKEAFVMLGAINFTAILLSFLFYFLFGYLLYASMYAAIGSAVENEADTQQLIWPVTIPLILGMLLMMHTFQYPNSSLSFWGSMIPFTSPMVMMARVCYGGVPFWEVLLSLTVLLVTIVGITWLAGKIYRVGILMYGKKHSLREMWKWMRW